MNVLIAEDTYVHMALLGYILSSEIPAEHLDVRLTNDGGEAFKTVMERIIKYLSLDDRNSTVLFDLLILDFSMPIMDGLKVAKILKIACEINEIAPPPVILLTSYDRDYFDPIDIDEKQVIYMKKPVNVDDLKATLNRLQMFE